MSDDTNTPMPSSPTVIISMDGGTITRVDTNIEGLNAIVLQHQESQEPLDDSLADLWEDSYPTMEFVTVYENDDLVTKVVTYKGLLDGTE